METKYAFERHVVETSVIHFDGNSKSTWHNGTHEEPQPNSLSFTQIDSCPYATTICMDLCYVNESQDEQPELHKIFADNYYTIRQELLPKYAQGSIAGVKSIANWIIKNSPGGFRWHNSGDVFSRTYAEFIRDVCVASSDIPHVIFTRSFPFLTPLMEAPNLAVNLSGDTANWEQAKTMARRTGARLTYLAHEVDLPTGLPEEGAVIFPDYILRGRDLIDPTSKLWWQGLELNQRKMVCPADFFGQDEKRRCGPCNLCLT